MRGRVVGGGRELGQERRADDEGDCAGEVSADLQGAPAHSVNEEEEDELGHLADDAVDALVEEGLAGRDAHLREDCWGEVLDC